MHINDRELMKVCLKIVYYQTLRGREVGLSAVGLSAVELSAVLRAVGLSVVVYKVQLETMTINEIYRRMIHILIRY